MSSIVQLVSPWFHLGLSACLLFVACNGEDGSGSLSDSGTTGATTGGTWAASNQGGAAGSDSSAGGLSMDTGGTQSSVGSAGTAGTEGDAAVTGDSSGSAGTSGMQTIAGGSEAVAGAGGTGGTTGSDNRCGSAEEGETTTLTCPDGTIIDSVVFASYGTPTRECGSFATGECHSATSQTVVETRCAGRRSCALAASNASFGDPCNGVLKRLSVEVSCVVGEPTVDQTPFKGVANSPASEIAALGATWCYNWMISPQASDCDDPLFVPMIKYGNDVAGDIQRISNAGYTTVLGFNEPNKADQADITVSTAIELWPDLTSNPDIRVGSPAVSDDGRWWLEAFMTEVQAQGLRVDFIAMHWYGWNAGSCVVSQFEGAINWAEQWELPIWITEWGCMGSSNSDEQTVLDFFSAAVAMIENHPLVERYAWYPWNTYNHLYLPDENGVRVMTPLGEAFAAAPAYRP